MAVLSAKTRGILIVIGIFLVGSVTGALVERRYHPIGSLTRRRPPADSKMHERIADRIQQRLELSDTQRDSVASILLSNQIRMQEVRSRIREEMRGIDRQIRQQIETVLTPSQAESFRDLRTLPGQRRRGHRRDTSLTEPPPDSPKQPPQ